MIGFSSDLTTMPLWLGVHWISEVLYGHWASCGWQVCCQSLLFWLHKSSRSGIRQNHERPHN